MNFMLYISRFSFGFHVYYILKFVFFQTIKLFSFLVRNFTAFSDNIASTIEICCVQLLDRQPV